MPSKRCRYSRAAVALLAVLLLAGWDASGRTQPTPPSGVQSPACADSSTRTFEIIVALEDLLLVEWPQFVDARQRLGLSPADRDSLRVVTDEAVCARARRVIDSVVYGGQSRAHLPLHIVRINASRYAVSDTTMRSMYDEYAVTDSAFVALQFLPY